ncbi:MAG: preprotein translocase subunit YajC [Actinobacteria bacterium]|nr:preprotein translocase subunit YajC [Actinomycetota bacterium]
MFGILAQEGGGQAGGSVVGLALPLLMIVGFYFLLIRPQRNRQRAQQAVLASLEVGDEVVTSSGIFGTIVEIDEDEGVLIVEIAPGTRVRMLRQGIAQRFVEDEDEEYDRDDDEDAGTADEGADREP